MLGGLLELIYRSAAVACGELVARDQTFCGGCSLQVEPLAEPRCQICAEPGPRPVQACARCVRRPPPFSRAYAPAAHAGPLSRSIHRFKYEDHPELARPLGRWLGLTAH